jgi:glycosyltransferase involved in cell wall biosynthesis
MKIILVSAFSISPNKGSEPGVGLIWSSELSKSSIVYVVTRKKLKEDLELYKLKNNLFNLNFIFIDSSSFLRKISIFLEYIDWQVKVFFYFKKKIKLYNFDYIWHLTFGNIFLPTLMFLFNVPFIWGPLGGGERVRFLNYKNFSISDALPHYLKSFLVKTIRFNPFVVFPERKAKLIIAKTKDTFNLLSTKAKSKSIIRLETVFDLPFHNAITINKSNDKIIFCYTGRLISFKNVLLSLEALKGSRINCDYIYKIIGDGPQRKYLESYVKNNKMDNNVVFLGNLPRIEALKILMASDIYLFPSLREGGSWALMEAMALGKPTICIKTNGMEMIADSSSAIMIPLESHSKMLINFQNAISVLSHNHDLRKKIGDNAKIRIENIHSIQELRSFIKNLVNTLLI